MEIFIGTEADCDELGAREIVKQIKSKPDSVLGLATGSTPEGIYRRLVEKHKNGEVSFARVKTFNLDEYVGIPESHVCSYHYFMDTNLFRHVDIDPNATHIPDGNAMDLNAECRKYEEMIAQSGGIDLQLLGIGPNGHIGFNEPETPFESLTHVVDLTDSTINANARFFESHEQVPRQAVTMGIKSIMQARRIILVAKGAPKAHVIMRAIKGPVTPKVPASVLQLHPNVLIILDHDAASGLTDLSK
ncbi:MAG TPA: glucosamine-6-phosphate deaminase [Candidatus Atribacteria bacterium]|mgnify:CR=1 FL=1|nr:glucosamine-6-phosphate deaminase [Candidatus Atribacteria bacterium]